LSTDNSSTIVTAGQTLRTLLSGDEPSYDVTCPSPVSIEKKATFQLSIVWLGRTDPVAIPFNGAEKMDLITFDMTWSALNSAKNGHLIADVDGLDIDKKYTCKFTQPDNEDITKSADGDFLGDKGRKMECGAQPTGFAISDENTAAVVFEVFVKGTKTKASYAGPNGEGPTIELDTCQNGKKDGDETDDDCGGACAALRGIGCGPLGACKVDGDCAGTIPCVDDICGTDGLTQETAAMTCKTVKIHFKDSKNGFYWVTGPNNEFTKANGKGPKKVMCWQEDRDGGGWTLAVKSWYGSHHHFAGGGRRQTNNINSGVMANMVRFANMKSKCYLLCCFEERHRRSHLLA
jgi:hypothetical protein